MSLINQIIPQQGFERVRSRLCEIITDEIENQVTLSYGADLDITVWEERTIDFDNAELPAINVSLLRGEYGNKNQGSVDGTYVYCIDAYTKAKKNVEDMSDKRAAIRLHKILGQCRFIIENPIYKTLGFEAPFITRVFCSKIEISDIRKNEKEDALSVMMGRLMVTVVCNENTSLKEPMIMSGYQTTVKLFETDKGYYYEG